MNPVRHEVDLFRPIYQIIRRINLGVDVRTALEEVTQGVVEAVGFQVAAISWLTADLEFEIVSVSGSEDARAKLLGSRVSLAAMEVELRASDRWGSLLFIPAGRLVEALDGWIPEVADAPLMPGRWEPEDTLRCPLRSPDGELLGLLSVDLPDDGMRPSPQRRELLEMYADLAGLALSNARRATALEERVRLAGAVEAALVSTNGGLDLAGLVASSAGPIAEALGASTFWLRITDPQSPGHGVVARVPDGTLVTDSALLAHVAADARAAWDRGEISIAAIHSQQWLSVSSARTDEVERVRVADGRAGWVGRRAATMTDLDAAQDRVLAFLEPLGVRHLVMCPVGVGAECFGYFVACRADDVPWSAEDIEAAGRLARHLGQSVLSAKLLERERVLVQQLEALDQYKNDLISTVSHELRTPLTAVIGHLELLEDAFAAGDLQSGRVGFEVIHRNLRRVLGLTDELLLLKKISDSGDEDIGVVDLRQIALDAVTSLRPQAEAKGVRLTLAPHGGPVLITGTLPELEQVVLNLVDNAIKYTPTGGEVDVATEHSTRFVRLVVRDSGLGISANDQEELFSEFFRSTNPDALAMPGTGLGLSIVRRIVQRHGGSIRVVSAPGEGSTFTVRLPLSHTRT